MHGLPRHPQERRRIRHAEELAPQPILQSPDLFIVQKTHPQASLAARLYGVKPCGRWRNEE